MALQRVQAGSLNQSAKYFLIYILSFGRDFYCNSGSVVERSPRKREVMGSIPDRVIPKTLKWYQMLSPA